MTVRRFGEIGGAEILEVTLASDAGAEARIITWGAVLRDLIVPGPGGRPQRVVLGLDRLEDYVAHSPYLGAIVGRYANRIAGARFRLGGQLYELDANENGRTQLHGGSFGFAHRAWALLAHDRGSATLALLSPDGEMGYPGRLVATCTYTLIEPATLRIVLEATADRPTPVNLTTHAYFNLDGGGDIRDHRLKLAADHVTPTDKDLIPTGEIRPVAGTAYDFREPRTLREAGGGSVDYDVNYVLRRGREPGELCHAASLSSERSGVAMEMWTTEPGLQVYDGHLLAMPVSGLSGAADSAYGGLCLEPQRFPDGPNRSYFPSCILEPGRVSRQVSELRFRA